MSQSVLHKISRHLLLLLLVLNPCFSNAGDPLPDKGVADAALIKKINADVATLDRKIKSGELEYLNVAYYSGPTEGVPPAFLFYYEYKQNKFILRACVIPVGHETWSKHFHYYFDNEGKPIKYLEKVQGRPDKPEPLAILYGPKNRIIWKNTDTARMSPSEVTDIFNRLNKNLEVFSHY